MADTFHERSIERELMVRHQLRLRGIEDERVLAAMRRVPRHRFVDVGDAREAYADGPLPIGYGQTISQPFVVAFMSAAAELEGDERVLEVGTGCGYQTAVLAELAREVHTIEVVPELAERAARTLAALGYANVHAWVGDGRLGLLDAAPFDAIVVTAAPAQVPDALRRQLAPGGRLIVPVGGCDQHIVRVRRGAPGTEPECTEERILPVRFVPLVPGRGPAPAPPRPVRV